MDEEESGVKGRRELKDESAAIFKNKGKLDAMEKGTLSSDEGDKKQIETSENRIEREIPVIQQLSSNKRINLKKQPNGKPSLYRQNSKEIKRKKQQTRNKNCSSTSINKSGKKNPYEEINERSSSRILAVDDMLANVDSIIYNVSYPKDGDSSTLLYENGEVRYLYDDTEDIDDEDEQVQSYTVFHGDREEILHEQVGDVGVVRRTLCEENPKEQFDDRGVVLGSVQFVGSHEGKIIFLTSLLFFAIAASNSKIRRFMKEIQNLNSLYACYLLQDIFLEISLSIELSGAVR